jgi:hypothetical protein
LRYLIVTLFISALAAPMFAVPGEVQAEDFTQFHSLGNGSTVRIYPPEVILRDMTSRDAMGNLVFSPEGGWSYSLIEDTDNPLIINKGAGAFFTMDEGEVLKALEAIDVSGRQLEMHVEIYILPMPRVGFMRSTSYGDKIFLSPGVWEISSATVAAIVTHEFGHCFQKAYMPYGDEEDWPLYLSMRGILDDPAYTEFASHMNRPSEIFAEDFRVLFGGSLALGSGMIENPYLAHPSDVPGLEEMIASVAGEAVTVPVAAGERVIASIGNYPNPFNPVTTIRADFSGVLERREVSVKIYAADGSLVRDLWSGMFTGETIEQDWNGLNRQGAPATSGVYFYRVTAGEDIRTGKMLLVR